MATDMWGDPIEDGKGSSGTTGSSDPFASDSDSSGGEQDEWTLKFDGPVGKFLKRGHRIRKRPLEFAISSWKMAWILFKKAQWQFIGLALLNAILTSISSALTTTATAGAGLAAVPMIIAVCSTLIALTSIEASTGLIKQDPFNFKDVTKGASYYFTYAIYGILFQFIPVLVGVIIAVIFPPSAVVLIPLGVYWLGVTGLGYFMIVREQSGVVDSFKKGLKLGHTHFLSWAVLLIVSVVCNALLTVSVIGTIAILGMDTLVIVSAIELMKAPNPDDHVVSGSGSDGSSVGDDW